MALRGEPHTLAPVIATPMSHVAEGTAIRRQRRPWRESPP